MRKLLLFLFTFATLVAAQKAVHVRTYTRKDGTVVHAHARATPAKKKPTLAPIIHRTTYGRIARSATAKRQFEASHPCPSTGLTYGSCTGYIIDHVKPLACGGLDAPVNMMWQTVADAKAKDRWERNGCIVQ